MRTCAPENEVHVALDWMASSQTPHPIIGGVFPESPLRNVRWPGGSDMFRLYALGVLMIGALLPGQVAPVQPKTPHHELTVTARRHAFDPTRLDVHQGDLVKITVVSEDIPHSFVVDAYRIAKKTTSARSVTFEFLADQAGTFEFYCNLTAEDGCRNMKGQLVVHPDTDGNATATK